jgi:hypothetical protein
MATATHQQNGQHCGKAKGSQVVQKPVAVDTVVRSTCQTWFGRLAVTTRPVVSAEPAASESDEIGGQGTNY